MRPGMAPSTRYPLKHRYRGTTACRRMLRSMRSAAVALWRGYQQDPVVPDSGYHLPDVRGIE